MITTRLTHEFVRGAIELESTDRGVRPHRLPRLIRERFADPQLALMEAQPSGVRIAVRTTAVDISLEVHATRITYRGARRARGAIDVMVDDVFHHSHVLTGGDAIEMDVQTGTRTRHRHRPSGRAENGRDLASPQRTGRSDRTALGRSIAACTDERAGVVTPRQLGQPRLQRHEPHSHLARRRGAARRRSGTQPGVRRQRARGSVHGSPHA